MDKIIRELPLEFIGKGEVKGCIFKQIAESERGCIYEVTSPEDTGKRYEVFMKVKNRRFGYYAYPKSKSWGRTAWTCMTLRRAQRRFDSFHSGN